jgi:RNA polymerase sigma-70 factor (ECF subfamily)
MIIHDPPSRPDDSDAAFARTRWSLVLGAGRRDADSGSLDELSQRYWYPVYAYVRRSGHPPGIANGLCQAFFAGLPARLHGLDPQACGRFRDVLLHRLEAFLTEDWRAGMDDDARGTGTGTATDVALAMDTDALEARSRQDHPVDSSPERAFQRSFALEILGRSMARLRAEAQQGGRADMFDALAPYLVRDPPPGEYDALSARLGTPSLALVIAVKRMRQRFRELADDELMETVASPRDLAQERSAMLQLLSGPGA